MNGYFGNIESLTQDNDNFRQVLYTAPHCQLVLMSLKPGEDIGQEIHEVDQFFRIEKGKAKAILNGIEHKIRDGDVVIVPAGTVHNITNISSTEPVKLYTVYAPPNHKDGTIHASKQDAEQNEEHFDGKLTE